MEKQNCCVAACNEKEKQALAASLSLTENAREKAMEVPAEDLGKADGMEKHIAQLGKLFSS